MNVVDVVTVLTITAAAAIYLWVVVLVVGYGWACWREQREDAEWDREQESTRRAMRHAGLTEDGECACEL